MGGRAESGNQFLVILCAARLIIMHTPDIFAAYATSFFVAVVVFPASAAAAVAAAFVCIWWIGSCARVHKCG